MRFGILGALFGGCRQSSAETVTNVRFLRDGRPPLECRTVALWKFEISSASTGRFGAAISRHCRGGSSAFWGHIILYVPVQDPVVGAALFVEMWETHEQTAPPTAGENDFTARAKLSTPTKVAAGDVAEPQQLAYFER